MTTKMAKPCKTVAFAEEQKQLKQELIELLRLQEAPFEPNVKTITLHELDQDDRKVPIQELLPRIRKYFTVRNKSLFYPDKTKRVHLTIVKYLMKEEYNVINKFVIENGVQTVRYFFYPLKKEVV